MYDPTKPYKKQILELIKQTWETPYVSVKDGIVEKKFSYPECHHIDGIGTKGIFHWEKRSFRNAVIDSLAMNLNDLALMRATPYALIDHLFLPEDDKDAILEIVEALSGECKKRNIAVTGGETAIHNNMEGLELSINLLGFIKKPKPNLFRKDDVLIGIESNGLHSNGFTRVREIFDYKLDFILPTNIYLDTLLKLEEEFDVHGMMHITGGAFTKLRDLLYDVDAIITNDHKLEPKEIFWELYEKGIPDDEMYKTFNCGVGFVLGVSKEDSSRCLDKIKDFKAGVIGEVVPGNGKIKIQSKFSNKEVVYLPA